MPAAIARPGEGAARRGPRRGGVRSARMAAGAVFSVTLLLAALAVMALKVGILLLLNSRSRHIPESDE